jgi:hypothetical protein
MVGLACSYKVHRTNNFWGSMVEPNVSTFRFNILYVASAGVSAGVFVSSLRLRFYIKKRMAFNHELNIK